VRRLISAGLLMGSVAALAEEPVVTGVPELVAAESAEVTPASEGVPLEVQADRIEYLGGLLIAEGHAVVRYEGTEMTADYISADRASGEVHAQGHVTFERDGNVWQGEELRYNFKTKTGDFGAFTAQSEKFYITADDAQRVSEHEYLLKGVTITPCEGDRPAVLLKAGQARLINGNYIKAKHIRFYVRDVPVFYLPYWERRLDEGSFHVVFGKSGDWGPYVRTITHFNLTPELESKTRLDYYNRRGIGTGQDFNYRGERVQAQFKTYWISDAEPRDKRGQNEDINRHDRYRLRYTMNVELGEKEYIKTRINYLSDPDIVEDFFNEEYRLEAQPENDIGYANSTDFATLGLYVNGRINRFYQNVDRLPEVSYDLYSWRLPSDSAWLYSSSSSFGYLDKRFENFSLNNGYHAWRFDTEQKLERPEQYFGFLNVIPRLSYRPTYYSDTPGGNGDVRHLFEAGVRTSFKAYKTLSETERFYGRGLRHLAEPYLDYTWRPRPNLQPANLFTGAATEVYNFDDIDWLDEANELRFGMRNVLQSRRRNGVANVIDLDLFTAYKFEPEKGEYDFSTLNADARFSLTERLNGRVDMEYDWESRLLNPINARVDWKATDDTKLYAAYRYRQREHDLITTGLELFPNNKWSFDFYTRYAKDDSRWEERALLVKRKFECVGLGLGYRNTVRDNQVWVYMWVLELPSIGINMGR